MGHGGARKGAGKKPGAKNVLGQGERAAIRSYKLRIPKDATPEQMELADAALQKIIDVMNGKSVGRYVGSVIQAASRVRDEVCGPVSQKMELTGKDGAPVAVFNVNLGEKDESPE